MFPSQVSSVVVRTEAFSAYVQGHGKSPCFSRCPILTFTRVDHLGPVLDVVYIELYLERAGCYG
jgi:hypothetical protein